MSSLVSCLCCTLGSLSLVFAPCTQRFRGLSPELLNRDVFCYCVAFNCTLGVVPCVVRVIMQPARCTSWANAPECLFCNLNEPRVNSPSMVLCCCLVYISSTFEGVRRPPPGGSHRWASFAAWSHEVVCCRGEIFVEGGVFACTCRRRRCCSELPLRSRTVRRAKLPVARADGV